LVGELQRKSHIENLVIDENVILKWFFEEIGCEGRDWIDVTKARSLWRSFAF
jgi:hypothetical protein